VVGSCRKLNNEELHNFYSSQSIIRMIKSRRMRWAGHVAHTGQKNAYSVWWEGQKEGDHNEDLDISSRIRLKCILEK
jgi:hypothetical protein